MKRSVSIRRHRTSISLEDCFWQGLIDIAAARQMRLSRLVEEIDRRRRHSNLSSQIRSYVLDFYRARSEIAGIKSPPREVAAERRY